ncbi:hypothetical protein LTR35_000509 [Friedmanniomyces endolithicus]|nr:hypothetical protein LTS00_009351 [Friedmanniomyces endolithicus]KAK0293901.1 hypothetical protein LTR35_000509 [Friedmanniomyces endolithicus]
MLGLGSNTFDPSKDIADLSGKVYVVTGGSSGIGFGIVAHLLQHNPERIYLLGKKEEHIHEAEESLKNWGDVSRITSLQIELEDLHQTASVAKQLASLLTRLDALVLNAGLGVGVYNETKDGIDSHFQVNSSELHRLGTSNVQFADLAEINQDAGPMVLYNHSKLAQILLAKSMVRHKKQSQLGLSPSHGPCFIATHPGGVSTDQPKQAEEAYGVMGKIGVMATRPFMSDPIDQGCRPALFAATSGDVVKEGLDGVYVVPDRKVAGVSSQAEDERPQEQCLRLVEGLLGEKLRRLPYETVYD